MRREAFAKDTWMQLPASCFGKRVIERPRRATDRPAGLESCKATVTVVVGAIKTVGVQDPRNLARDLSEYGDGEERGRLT